MAKGGGQRLPGVTQHSLEAAGRVCRPVPPLPPSPASLGRGLAVSHALIGRRGGRKAAPGAVALGARRWPRRWGAVRGGMAEERGGHRSGLDGLRGRQTVWHMIKQHSEAIPP